VEARVSAFPVLSVPRGGVWSVLLMATFLYRVGRWSFRRRRLVAVLWLVALLLAGVGAALAPEAGDEEFTMPGTESQEAFDLLEDRFPGSNAEGADARLVFQAPDGQRITAPEHRAAVRSALDGLNGGQVESVTDPFGAAGAVSQDGTIAYATVTYTADSTALTETTTTALQDAAGQAQDAGLTVEIGGSALQTEPEIGGATELIGLAVAAAVLVVTFGSLVAAGLPLLTAIVGVAISFCLIAAVSSPLGLTSTASLLALMLGLAVGIDYALFIASRYRDERAEGSGPEDAAGRAAGTAGTAVVFAGLTVIVALAGLSVVGVPELTKMGLAAAGSVAMAVCVALTLVPALCGFFGRRMLPRAARAARTARKPARAARKPGLGDRWARFVLRRPLAVLVLCVAGLGALAAPALSLELGLPGDEAESTETTQRRAYDLLSQGFGPGFNGPLTVVVDTRDAGAPQDTAARVSETVAGIDGVVTVSEPEFNEAGDTAVLTAVPASGPSSGETSDLVHTLRDEVSDVTAETGGDVLVTGRTAMNIDVSQGLADALVPYLAVVVGLAVLLLTVVFRSVLVPVKAALGFLLSVCAALGVIVAVFQWGWAAELVGVEQTGPVMSLMPILMIGLVFGLAMDYEVFLLSRMREAHAHGETPDEAIVSGFRHSGRVVAAAAFIMISVFAGFIGIDYAIIKTMGVGLAAAVAFDAFVVRMAIGPAVLALLGRHAWWLPRSLDRMLPNVDVEGQALAASPASVPPAVPQAVPSAGDLPERQPSRSGSGS
jgi:putative drug exporter of the RND superfamily